jgi:hypothetical protein
LSGSPAKEEEKPPVTTFDEFEELKKILLEEETLLKMKGSFEFTLLVEQMINYAELFQNGIL